MAPAFLSPLQIQKIGPYRWLLLDDLIFQSAIYPGLMVAPRGFQTDFASVPRFAWIVAPPVGAYDAATVIHDAAYEGALMTAPIEEDGSTFVHAIKTVADDLLDEAMQVCHVPTWQRIAMVTAVRQFGPQPSWIAEQAA